MSIYEPNSHHLREILIFCFNMKKSAAEAHRMLSNTYTNTVRLLLVKERVVNGLRTVILTSNWHRDGREKVFEDAELEALLDQDSCQNQEELARSLGVTQQAISKLFKVMGMIQKQGNWVPYELKPRDVNGVCLLVNSCLKSKDGKDFCIEL
ncbi:Mariner Mos1 transposase [Acromyrmex echinatior]|uniref:Mariner Mos1 transposase n=1 Tax=Acromyrmex echinatior TaxID=103372 RepID=F4WGN5_ACREC|nr:Mariner Mos1 transposase [Acromyrmex echinatior]